MSAASTVPQGLWRGCATVTAVSGNDCGTVTLTAKAPDTDDYLRLLQRLNWYGFPLVWLNLNNIYLCS